MKNDHKELMNNIAKLIDDYETKHDNCIVGCIVSFSKGKKFEEFEFSGGGFYKLNSRGRSSFYYRSEKITNSC